MASDLTPEQIERERCLSIYRHILKSLKKAPDSRIKDAFRLLEMGEMAIAEGWTRKRETPSEFSLEEIEAAQDIIDEGQS